MYDAAGKCDTCVVAIKLVVFSVTVKESKRKTVFHVDKSE